MEDVIRFSFGDIWRTNHAIGLELGIWGFWHLQNLMTLSILLSHDPIYKMAAINRKWLPFNSSYHAIKLKPGIWGFWHLPKLMISSIFMSHDPIYKMVGCMTPYLLPNIFTVSSFYIIFLSSIGISLIKNLQHETNK